MRFWAALAVVFTTWFLAIETAVSSHSILMFTAMFVVCWACAVASSILLEGELDQAIDKRE